MQMTSRRGVYRFRREIDGCPVWYALDDDGAVLGLEVIHDAGSQVAAVASLVRLAHPDAKPDYLRLISSDAADDVAVSHRIRLSPALLARVFRSQRPEGRAPLLETSASDPF